MAFSTQREILNFPFRNEEPTIPDRKRSDCQLKSYESCTDVRAWSMNPKVTAKFLLDVAHKSRYRRKLPRPRSSDGQLTKAYLQQLDVEELLDYVMNLMVELEDVKSKVQLLEAHQNPRQVGEIDSTYDPDKEEKQLISNLKTIICYKTLLIALIVTFMILIILNLVILVCSK
ncbi:uncharacterized protein LOC110678768 [Aedes aegypti]|uniref:Uncharacterized protein n=1 Tax=Aedes aegypti TaxID=7159 RepID=A0A6I8U9B6_AEDAE|nr:uncharacterized protein LOC110678768 [Aedes aegypti]